MSNHFEDLKLCEEDVIKGIDLFTSIKWKPYKNGENPDNYLKYFEGQFSACFKNGIIPVFSQKAKLFDSFYRFRKYEDTLDINAPKTYSYPDAKFCENIKRVNLPNYPVFYCSQHPAIAIMEMEKWDESQKKYLVAKWKKKRNEDKLNFLPIHPSYDEFKDTIRKTIDTWCTGSNDYKNAMYRMLTFIGDKIMSEDDYSVSACFAHKYLYSGLIDVISYPSSIDNKGINFAFSTNAVDKLLFLDRVYFVELGSNRQLTLYKVGIFSKSRVEWYNADSLDQSQVIFKTFNEDFSSTANPIIKD
jgi:hypothetical protein